MPALSFGEFDSLPDVLALDRFSLMLAPAGGASDVNQTLAIRCTMVTIGAESTEVMPISIQGLEFNFRGRRIYDKAMQTTFIETTDGAVQNSLRSWTQNICGGESGNGQNKKQYATQGSLSVFDQSGNTALLFLIDNVWPSDLQQVQLDGNQAQPYFQNVTFTYDRLRPPNNISMQ